MSHEMPNRIAPLMTEAYVTPRNFRRHQSRAFIPARDFVPESRNLKRKLDETAAIMAACGRPNVLRTLRELWGSARYRRELDSLAVDILADEGVGLVYVG